MLLIVAVSTAACVAQRRAIDVPAEVAVGLEAIWSNGTRCSPTTSASAASGHAASVPAGRPRALRRVDRRTGAKRSGAAVACLLLVHGLGRFGENLPNVRPIVIGAALYSRRRGEGLATQV
jgi:hypothetical protein